LLKVTVPKRTGRKRKRGTNGPFLEEFQLQNGTSRDHHELEADKIHQALIDNPEKYTVEAVGISKENHRFRSFPDYQYATRSNSTMNKLRETIMTENIETIRNFQLDMRKGLPLEQDVGPPPYFTINRTPYNYMYRQNIYVKTMTDHTGAVQTVNITAPMKHIRTYIDPDDENVPMARPADLPPEHTLPPKMQDRIQKLRGELDKRPLMQRRVYMNLFNGQFEYEMKQAAGYCGYTFSSGPFKDVLIAFGVDPRTDPKYRIYQAVSFQVGHEVQTAPDNPGAYMAKKGGRRVFAKKATLNSTHIFDGTKLYTDGKVWQVCDITDPFLAQLLGTKDLRKDCDMTFSGWYGNGTWSLFRRIMKHKLALLAEGKPPALEMYSALVSMFPPFIDGENVHRTHYDRPGFFKEGEYKDYPIDTEFALMSSEVRSMAMAAWRVETRGKKFYGRQRRLTSESAASLGRGSAGSRRSSAGSRRGSRRNSVASRRSSVAGSPSPSEIGRRTAAREEEDDKALLGYDDVSEEEDELEDESVGEDVDGE
jgi:general transcription factor 3C polypeptide 5 (transcription factor C subunit 1)